MRCLLALLMGGFGPLSTGWAQETIPYDMNQTVTIRVTEAGPDAYRVSIAPHSAGPSPQTTPIEVRSAGGTTRLVVNPASAAWTVDREGLTLWQGSVSNLPAYGRAGVPGLHLAWRSTPGEHLYGLGERFDDLDQHGKRVEMWIRDAPGMGDGASYFCTPVLFSSAGYAWFATTNPEGEFDLNRDGTGRHHYRRAGTTLVFYLVFSDSLASLLKQRSALQGPLRPLPDWAWGPWISRNSYENQAEAEAAIHGMVSRGLPVAAIVQEAWKGRSETDEFNRFSLQRWPDLDRYFALCREHGVRTILWQVPVLHPSSPSYADGVRRGFFVKAEDGSVSHRREWLAGFANIDFTNPEAVAWFKDQLRPVLRMGVAGFKADDGEDIKPLDVFHDGRRGWEMHNEYSTLYNLALMEAIDEEGAEGMLWARSGSLGIERAPAMWAGDQFATWEQLRALLPAGLSASLSGMPFWGHDIGGYIGDPGPELYVRWLQFGAFSPLMQYHGVQRREPWEFGETALQAYRLLSHLRMNLGPTLRALGKEAAQTGLPIMRPMTLEFPDDARFGRETSQYMLGPDLLVTPVLHPDTPGRFVLFPEGTWQHLLDPVSYSGPGEIEVPLPLWSAPVFVREGSRLAVELDADASLGQWRRGAPVRELEFTAHRAAIRNPRVPIQPSLLSPYAPFAFEAREDLAGHLVLTVAAGPDFMQETSVPLQVDGLHHTAQLPPPSTDASRDQVQRLRLRNPADGDALIWETDLRWQVPVLLSLDPGPLRLVDVGPRALKTTLRNRSADPAEVTLTFRADGAATVSPSTRAGVLAPGEEVEWVWQVECPPADDLAGVGIHAVLHSGDRVLREASLLYARPLTWAVAGPFPTEPQRAHATPHPPLWNHDPGTGFAAGTGVVRWTAVPAADVLSHAGLDFIARFGPQSHAAVYALAKVECDEEQPVEVRAGSDDTLTLWVNGELLHRAETYRKAAWDQIILPARLVKGSNLILAKVGQQEGDWQLHVHLTKPGGAPLHGARDAFADIAAYAADRPPPDRVIAHPGPLQWQVAGPFPASGPDALSGPGPLDGVCEGAAWPPPEPAAWRPVPAAVIHDGAVNLGQLLGPAQNAFAYAATLIEVDEPTPVELLCGSDDGLLLWLNGDRLVTAHEMRMFAPDANRVTATLRAGRNVLYCRISQGQGDWRFRVEARDPSSRPPRPLGSVSEGNAALRPR